MRRIEILFHAGPKIQTSRPDVLRPVKDFTLLILLFVLYVAVPSLFRCDQFVE